MIQHVIAGKYQFVSGASTGVTSARGSRIVSAVFERAAELRERVGGWPNASANEVMHRKHSTYRLRHATAAVGVRRLTPVAWLSRFWRWHMHDSRWGASADRSQNNGCIPADGYRCRCAATLAGDARADCVRGS